MTVSDENANIKWWPLGVAEQVVTNSDGLARMVDIKTASGTLIRDVRFIGFLKDVEGADDITVSHS